MANIYDYLQWRGDIPFSVDGFNEVDNVILSRLSYADFDGIDGIDKSFISLEEVRSTYFKTHTREEIKNRKTLIATAPLLLDSLYETERYKELQIGYYENIIDADDVFQFAAVTYKIGDINYIAFRGTDDTIVGWKEDFYFSYKTGTKSQIASVKYLNKYAKDFDKFELGGHSKGGNLAIFSSSFCEKKIQDKIQKIWANDSPGFSEQVIEKQEYKNIMERIYLIIPESSVIGMLMDNTAKPHIIRSDSKLLMQHDVSTWQVLANKFVVADKLSEEAIFVDKSIKSWLEEIPVDKRKEAIDSVFYCLESSNVTTFAELREGGFSSLKQISLASKSLSKEQSDLISELVNKLISNSKNIFLEDLKNKIENNKLSGIFDKKKPNTKI